jgi:hypothetical protein
LKEVSSSVLPDQVLDFDLEELAAGLLDELGELDLARALRLATPNTVIIPVRQATNRVAEVTQAGPRQSDRRAAARRRLGEDLFDRLDERRVTKKGAGVEASILRLIMMASALADDRERVPADRPVSHPISGARKSYRAASGSFQLL